MWYSVTHNIWWSLYLQSGKIFCYTSLVPQMAVKHRATQQHLQKCRWSGNGNYIVAPEMSLTCKIHGTFSHNGAEWRVTLELHQTSFLYSTLPSEGRLTVAKKNWALIFVMTILWWHFEKLKMSAKRAPISSSFCPHFSSTKMSSQNAFSTPKSIHIHKINSQIGLFNSLEKWALIFLRKSIWGQNQLVRCFFGDC